MRVLSSVLVTSVLAVSVAAAAPAHAQAKGEGGSAVKGSAGPSGAPGAASDLERCDKPMAALAVGEPQSHVLAALSRYRLGSPTGLIRLMVQQSNCFLVVERGVGLRNMAQERDLGKAGELRQNSNMGGGQMIAADYIMTPAVVFSEDNAGGVGGAVGGVLGGVLGPRGRAIGAIAGGVKFKEAQTSMLLADSRSGLQVAAAEGSAKATDFRLGGLLAGYGGGAALGGYDNTAEGKLLAASLADNYNGVVRAVRGNPSLQRDVGTLAEEAGRRLKGGVVFNEGDVLRPKIANVKLFAEPSDGSQAVATLGKGEELIFMGKEQDGFVNVETSRGGGWVKKVLITR